MSNQAKAKFYLFVVNLFLSLYTSFVNSRLTLQQNPRFTILRNIIQPDVFLENDSGGSMITEYSQFKNGKFTDSMKLLLANPFSIVTPYINQNATNPVGSTITDRYSTQQIFRDMSTIKNRLDKLEKLVASNQLSGLKSKQLTPVGSFLESLSANTLEMNSKTVETCSIISFFLIGIIIGASLLDRLWLFGGISLAWWASTHVNRDTRDGRLIRRVGARFAKIIQDIQEKYNQAVIFYRTGKLAYLTSKTWEQYDETYSITKRMNELKRRAMERAISLNSSSMTFTDQMYDIWNVMQSAPKNAIDLDRKYRLTSSASAIARGVWTTTSELVSELIDIGSASATTSIPLSTTYPTKSWSFSLPFLNRMDSDSSRRKGFISSFSNPFLFLNRSKHRKKRVINNKRGNLINPWSLPLTSHRSSSSSENRWFRLSEARQSELRSEGRQVVRTFTLIIISIAAYNLCTSIAWTVLKRLMIWRT